MSPSAAGTGRETTRRRVPRGVSGTFRSLPNGINTTPGKPGRQVTNDKVEASRAMLPYGQEAPEEKRPLTRGTVEDSRKTNRRGNQIPPTKSSRAVRALPEAARWVTLGLAPPGNEIPPLRGRQKPLQDPTPVERARTVTRMAGVLNHAFAAWFKRRSQLRGAWGRRPKGDAPRSEAGAWGLAGCLQPDPSHPALVTREDPGVEPCRFCQPFLPD